MPFKIRTRLIEQVIRLNRRGEAEPFFRIEFDIGSQGPFSFEVSMVEFTTETIRRKQEEIATVVKEQFPELE